MTMKQVNLLVAYPYMTASTLVSLQKHHADVRLVVDSGKTKAVMLEAYTPCIALSWIGVNPETEFKDFVLLASANEWLVFPWESKSKAEADRDAYLSRQ